ncbi:MAG: hypothetical protein CMJ68_11840 [Planctomycetaceae bacterium]|nr:hypothetical protein [Planctomycetaceae bacterium]
MTQPRQRVGIAVVLTRDGTRCLVGIRSSETSLANMLEFPGGKSVPGESTRDTAIRECLEETGIAVDAIQLLEHRSHDYDHGRVALDFWLCHARGDHDQPSATQPFGWRPTRELNLRDFPKANAGLIRRLVAAESLEQLAAGGQTESTHD